LGRFQIVFKRGHLPRQARDKHALSQVKISAFPFLFLQEGVVIKQWDEQNPYRIELLDEAKTNVWGLVDEDKYVKKVAAA
jgi:hypothetical protein